MVKINLNQINLISILMNVSFLIIIFILLSLLINSNSKLNESNNFNYTAILNQTLCGCKKLSSNYTIKAKIFNGTELSNSFDLPWIASLFLFNSTSDFTIDHLFPICTGVSHKNYYSLLFNLNLIEILFLDYF